MTPMDMVSNFLKKQEKATKEEIAQIFSKFELPKKVSKRTFVSILLKQMVMENIIASENEKYYLT